MILAIDPGTTLSAYVVYDGERIIEKGHVENDEMLSIVERLSNDYGVTRLAVEMVACYGMAVGREVFETCVWIGRFIEAWRRDYSYVYRKDVKMHLCNSTRAKDANVRQALLDRFGRTRQEAVGTKKAPGPLYGVAKDIWAALGVAVTFSEDEKFVGARV